MFCEEVDMDKHIILTMTGCLFPVFLQCFYIDMRSSRPCPRKKYTSTLDVEKRFLLMKPNFRAPNIVTDPLALQAAIRDIKAFISHHKKTHSPVINPYPFSTKVLSLNAVLETLNFIDKTIEEDKKTGVFRIQDTSFLLDNFGFIQWNSDHAAARLAGHGDSVPANKIRLTSYVMYKSRGSYNKTASYAYPLYKISNTRNRIRLTKQEILAGGLAGKKYDKLVSPIVWVSKSVLEQAMLQGTIFLTMPDNKKRAFTVTVSNGYRFNHREKNLSKQKIYWFFSERNGAENVDDILERAEARKGVIFAGDLYALGIGKLIALSYYSRPNKRKELLLGVIGDTGSAFDNNLYQLDLFGGVVTTQKELFSYLRNFPPAVRAFILYRKKSQSST